MLTKHDYKSIQEIPLLVLEQLRVKDITEFENYLRIRLRNADLTVNRKLSSLKSLFHYLSQIAEDENLYPYLKRNVMAKVEMASVRVSVSKKAEKIENQFSEPTIRKMNLRISSNLW
ncbi:hypothetical protein [Ammoniphilus sp. 3BR4]|uniref:hypothetical protein n=1 Tax=Ammoniphilus sp. 3BR4 TaxID=3158265 RepID=UPI003467DEB0